ncbi:DoxX family membrane protein [Isoptericola halotolerans]|uniref:Thiosulfate dehydrogenase [quinone] large subunit n=1 Tax=Isoptericola halotolerans TaxID=300560 RepID=A0ABX2A2D7_9MICO|nr:hypothetical protein [Isoptericola halotolerans]NOV97012.1 thiosulfate dehydrogenase [quinone] large subunit [Isoptericola halotolerans]
MTTAVRGPQSIPTTPEHTGLSPAAAYTFAVLRLLIAFQFLWAFADKTFGLGLATPAENAWVAGGSPTMGFLSNVEGPFAGFFGALAGVAVVDWLFMLGLLGIGLAFALGIGMRVAAVSGAVMLVMMWMAALPIEVNPFLDDHLIEAVLLIGLAAVAAGDTLGLGRRWAATDLVQRYPILR